jgi:NAD(P)H-flavin reductase
MTNTTASLNATETANKLKAFVQDPEQMVKAYKQLMKNKGIDPILSDDQIRLRATGAMDTLTKWGW